MEDGKYSAGIFVHPAGNVKGCVSGRDSSSWTLDPRFFLLYTPSSAFAASHFPKWSFRPLFDNSAIWNGITIRVSKDDPSVHALDGFREDNN